MGSEPGASAGRVTRAALLRRATVAGAAAALPAGTISLPTAEAAVEREQLEALTAEQAAVVAAIVARLIPTDSLGPGAAEAKVARFIDRALAGAYKFAIPDYNVGLEAVDSYALSKYGSSFVSLTGVQQDAILSDMEKGTATGFVPNSQAFFELIREHTLQGMFGDPYYGGNADFIGWDMIRYPGLKLVWSAADQRIKVNVPKSHKSASDIPLFKPDYKAGA
jgi:gluconate 2-dehydrogenase gamma chain